MLTTSTELYMQLCTAIRPATAYYVLRMVFELNCEFPLLQVGNTAKILCPKYFNTKISRSTILAWYQ